MALTAQQIVSGLIQRGVPAPAAYGLAGNFAVESGFDPGINEAAPVVPGSRGGFGLAQWTGPRRRQLENFAASQGRDVSDPDAQLDFLMWELGNTERSAGQAIMAAQTPEDAARIVSERFLRPGIPHLERRIAETSRIAGGGDTLSGGAGTATVTGQDSPIYSPEDAQRYYDAFTSGRMTPEHAAQYEAAVASGAFPLPQGVASLDQRQAVNLVQVDPGAVGRAYKAYVEGRMAPDHVPQFEAAVQSGQITLPGGADLSGIVVPTLQGPAANYELQDGVPVPIGSVAGGSSSPNRSRMASMSGEAFAGAGAALAGAAGMGPSPTTARLTGFNELQGIDPTSAAGRTVGMVGRTGDIGAAALGGLAGAWNAGAGAVGDIADFFGMDPQAATALSRDLAAMPEAFAGSPGSVSVIRGPMANEAIAGARAINKRARELERGAPSTIRSPAGAPVAPVVTPAAPVVAAATPEAMAQQIGTAARSGAGFRRAGPQIAAQADIDAGAIATAERLGMDLPADVFSRSQVFREQIGLNRSQVASPASSAWRQTTIDTLNRADEIFTELGASPDISSISARTFQSLDGTRTALKTQADDLYARVDAAVPRSSTFSPDATVRALNSSIEDLGGNLSSLTPSEARLYRMVTGDAPVTYEAIMREKRAIGRALERGDGPYADADQALLKRLYGALAEDQMTNVAAIGGDALASDLRIANGLYSQRAGLQDQIVSAFGKDLEGSIAQRINTAITQSGKGDVANLNRVINVIPQELRREAVLTGISSATRGRATGLMTGADGRPFGMAQYVDFYNGLRNNSEAYAIIAREIGPEAAGTLRDLYEVSRYVRDAQANVLTTGKANQQMLANMAAEGIVDKVLSTSLGQWGTRATGGAVGTALGGGTGAMMGAAALDISKAARVAPEVKIGNMITSPQFRRLLEEAATQTNIAPGTIRAVANSREFRRWADQVGIPNPEGWLAVTIAQSQSGDDRNGVQ